MLDEGADSLIGREGALFGWRKERPIVSIGQLYHELCKNGLTDLNDLYLV